MKFYDPSQLTLTEGPNYYKFFFLNLLIEDSRTNVKGLQSDILLFFYGLGRYAHTQSHLQRTTLKILVNYSFCVAHVLVQLLNECSGILASYTQFPSRFTSIVYIYVLMCVCASPLQKTISSHLAVLCKPECTRVLSMQPVRYLRNCTYTCRNSSI